VGRRAETVAETVSDAVVRLAQKTPFVEAPKPHRGRWMFRAAIVATIAGVAMWLVNRRRTAEPWYGADETQTSQETGATERRFATAGH
jgi:hypothetical protein